MKVIIPKRIQLKLKMHLLFSSRREIGGLLYARDLGGQVFRIIDFTVDTRSGTESYFSRCADLHEKKLKNLHARYKDNYSEYNYLGEWHSHPSFSVLPSHQDITTMLDLVDGTGDVNFAVLLITRLFNFNKLGFSGRLFINGESPYPITVDQE